MERRSEAERVLILVVERDPHVRALERFFLEQAGFVVQFIADGADALDAMRRLHPVVLISEILVPRLDGLSVCRAIKTDPTLCGTLVVIFSILAAEDRAAEAGADAFLRKPLNESLLIETLQRLLAPRHERSRDHEEVSVAAS
jgi:two-component system response regulator MprA